MRLALLASLGLACSTLASPSTDTSDLTTDARQQRETIIRDVAAQRGLRNGFLLAGIAEAEVHLAHCWSEATWACPGPASAECGGPVVAGRYDGDCGVAEGGLGLFQFDSGTHGNTLAVHGNKILDVRGSVEAAVEFVVQMAINSVYTPASVTDRASALAWLDQVTIDGPTYDVWLKTVVHYYNGCAPGVCGAYQQRRQKYDTAMRTVFTERGAAFWGAAASAQWVNPLASSTWQVDFNLVNPYAPGDGPCFGKKLNKLVHAGEDWATTGGSHVRAIGAGRVEYAAYAQYPGSVVVIRHDLAPAQRAALGTTSAVIYSMYGHLANVLVATGATVAAGQHIANVLDQGSNSHLHWEVRTARVPQLCGFTVPGPGYTDSGTDARNWGYLDPASSVAALAAAGSAPATCDNGVALDATACASSGDSVEYVCRRPGQPSAQQWDARACAPGSTCTGSGCQPSTCASHTSVAACDATGGACAWYACVNTCHPTGTDTGQVCGGSWSCADSAWGTGQLWTCGADGDRHKCSNGTPVADNCALGCLGSAAGRDDLCVQSDPGWSCANSAWGTAQLWTCSGGALHRCQNGVPVRVSCPAGCTARPPGVDDTCT